MMAYAYATVYVCWAILGVGSAMKSVEAPDYVKLLGLLISIGGIYYLTIYLFLKTIWS